MERITDDLSRFDFQDLDVDFYFMRGLQKLLNLYYDTPTGYFKGDENPRLCFDDTNCFFIINDINQILFTSMGDLILCEEPEIHQNYIEFQEIKTNINLSEMQRKGENYNENAERNKKRRIYQGSE